MITPFKYSLYSKSLSQLADYLFPLKIYDSTAGGGGERVLWTAIKALQESNPSIISVLYTDYKDNESKELILSEKKFSIEIDPNLLLIIRVKNVSYIDKRYSYLRLLLQSLASMLVCYQTLNLFIPDIYIDTVGFSFTYPLVKILYRINVVSYTHYPTISSDMYQVVASRESGINNGETIQKSFLLSILKKLYYRMFFVIYGFSGSYCDSVMANSTWTLNHIKATFKKSKNINLVYPPCDSKNLSAFSFEDRALKIVSLAQFRPEKHHSLQIVAFAKLLNKYPQWQKRNSRSETGFLELVMIGGARNKEDEERANELRELSKMLNIGDQVSVVTNASFEFICEQLSTASIGLHSMKDEHFGINVVEFMAAGLLPISHNSGGPKMDIIVPAVLPEEYSTINSKILMMLLEDARKEVDFENSPDFRAEDFAVGFLASNSDQFADAIQYSLTLDKHVFRTFQRLARSRATTLFSDQAFKSRFLECLNLAIDN
ncbi:hypothetical protein BB560_003816 [Smittium megazygosporum]|uniref:GDP-Man:Man(3)GlcNAc(2)-PP-Dol alpha-1,2-mannosyltransferase n=1 Tax=Smittium megazygosporum TaxID=133381 RepID=A0A2T9ZB23_9FUNG|nr:hypothetical protein BB560_003816 [Smittium megazygosporum]